MLTSMGGHLSVGFKKARPFLQAFGTGLLLLVCFSNHLLTPVSALSGPNVCTKQETYTTIVNVSYQVATPVRTYTFCYSIPPKCSKFKIIYVLKNKKQTQSKIRTKNICCTGYTPVLGEDRCQPICSRQCIHGVCVKPDECQCETGYSGASCHLDQSSSENVTAQTGSTVVLFCNTIETEIKTVTWIRRRDVMILMMDMMSFSRDERFSAQHKTGTNKWALSIRFVQLRDQGTYECQVRTLRGTEVRQQSHLVHLSVITPRAVISGNDQYRVGSTITLDCIIEESAPKYIIWYHNNRLLNYKTERDTVTPIKQPPSNHSQLRVPNAAPTDGGNYTCDAANAEPASVVVYITQATDEERAAPNSPSPAPFSPWDLPQIFLRILTLFLGE